MKSLRISTAQFENRSGDKEYNLGVIGELASLAAAQDSNAIAFHECSVTGYTFARNLTRKQMLDLAEQIPNGPSTQKLIRIARKNKIKILAGLFEKEQDEKIYKAYICVDGDGLIAKHRKLHPFINTEILPGKKYTVFGLDTWTCGILICYDNNIVENVRATKLLGADIIFMPHVTMCTPSPRPGAGFIDPQLWYNRNVNEKELRKEFDGPKGREWLLKWLPSRAWDNAAYVIFSNPVGMDDDQLKNGCSMIIDPFGDIIAECRKLGNDLVTASISFDKVQNAGGSRYLKARNPDLYRDILGKEHTPDQNVIWMNRGSE